MNKIQQLKSLVNWNYIGLAAAVLTMLVALNNIRNSLRQLRNK